MPRAVVFVLSLVLLPCVALAKPPSREESDRQSQVVDHLKEALAAEPGAAGKFARIQQVLANEPDVDLRRRILEIAGDIPGTEREAFLTTVLKTEEDSGLRSQAATRLGETGSEECFAVLTTAAASDPTTSCTAGCIVGRGSARRAAIFALAALAERFPGLADRIAADLRKLPAIVGPPDNESLADARIQALFQVTRDRSLLKPFFDRLKSADPRERASGVGAFQALKLKQAPPEIFQALGDSDADVRSWTAHVLGEIGDLQAVDPLMKIAADASAERPLRGNAIFALGRMRARAAADLMERLLDDADFSAHAAIALYRITGRKTQRFPEGYRAD